MFRSDRRNFAIILICPAFFLRIFKGVYVMAAKQLFNGSKTAVQGDPAVCERFSTASNLC